MCSNTSFPRLNFLFMPAWKSKVAKLFVTGVRWVVGSQLNIAILCKIEYLEVRWEEQSQNLYGQDHTFPLVMTETIGSKSGPSTFSFSFGMSVHSQYWLMMVGEKSKECPHTTIFW